MKTGNLKTSVLLAVSLLSLSSAMAAGSTNPANPLQDGTQTTIPHAPAPSSNGNSTSPFDEGTETTLTPGQMTSIRAWASNSKENLDSLLDDVRSLPIRRSKTELIRRIQQTVLASAPKNTELLMRYVLNRV